MHGEAAAGLGVEPQRVARVGPRGRARRARVVGDAVVAEEPRDVPDHVLLLDHVLGGLARVGALDEREGRRREGVGGPGPRHVLAQTQAHVEEARERREHAVDAVARAEAVRAVLRQRRPGRRHARRHGPRRLRQLELDGPEPRRDRCVGRVRPREAREVGAPLDDKHASARTSAR